MKCGVMFTLFSLLFCQVCAARAARLLFLVFIPWGNISIISFDEDSNPHSCHAGAVQAQETFCRFSNSLIFCFACKQSAAISSWPWVLSVKSR